MPKPRTPAHLLLAHWGLEKARGKLRKGMQKNVVSRVNAPIGASDSSETKRPNLARAVTLIGVSAIARRSLPGAILIGGGYLAKTMLAKSAAERSDTSADTKNEANTDEN